jgi:pyrroline-5-carboxylate reductase
MDILAQQRLALIGGGVMAEAIIRGLLNQGLAAPQQLLVSEPIAQRREQLAHTLGVGVTASNGEAVAGAQIVLFAVKPQVLSQVLGELAGRVPSEALVLSIVAGAPMAAFRQALGDLAMVRIMPNTPAQVGEGISVWTATPQVSERQRQQARAIIGALGEEVYVEEEKYLDMATALSGSGPGYVFLFIEALIDAGVRLGFARPVAEKLVLQTVRGSAILAQRTGQHPAVLRNMVTSPGGTTAEGLVQLEEGGLRAAVARAVWASYERALALGKGTKG